MKYSDNTQLEIPPTISQPERNDSEMVDSIGKTIDKYSFIFVFGKYSNFYILDLQYKPSLNALCDNLFTESLTLKTVGSIISLFLL